MLIVVVMLVTSPNVNTTMNEQNDVLLPKVIAVTAVMSFVKSQVELSFSYG